MLHLIRSRSRSGSTSFKLAAVAVVVGLLVAAGLPAVASTSKPVLVWHRNGGDVDARMVPPTFSSAVEAVDVGQLFAAALTADGGVKVWGIYKGSSTGTSTRVDQVPAAARSSVVAISAGSTHILALRSDGEVVAWGQHSKSRHKPPVFDSPVIAVSAAAVHNLALLADGNVVAWGADGYGPIEPPPFADKVVRIWAGNCNFALLASGEVVAWGFNDAICPDGPAEFSSPPAQLVVTQRPVSGGGYESVAAALLENGDLVVWSGSGVEAAHPALPGGSVLALDRFVVGAVLLLRSSGELVSLSLSDGTISSIGHANQPLAAISYHTDYILGLVGQPPPATQFEVVGDPLCDAIGVELTVRNSGPMPGSLRIDYVQDQGPDGSVATGVLAPGAATSVSIPVQEDSSYTLSFVGGNAADGVPGNVAGTRDCAPPPEEPTITLNPSLGPPGTTFEAAGTVCAGGAAEVRLLDTTGTMWDVVETSTTAAGTWEVPLTIPAGTTDFGEWTVEASCGIADSGGVAAMGTVRAQEVVFDYTPAPFTVIAPPAPPGGGRLVLDNSDPGDAPVAITPGQTITVGNAPDAPCVGGDLVEGSTGGLATDATFASVPDAAGDWETTLEIPADVVPGEYQLMADCLNGEDVVFTYAPIVVEIADDTPTTVPPTTVPPSGEQPPTTVPPTTVPPSDEQPPTTPPQVGDKPAPPTTPPQVGDKPAPPALPVPEQPDYTG